MYISYNWLQDFVNLPKSYTAEKLALALTMHTVEVEGVESLEERFSNVIVGKVLEVNKHPQADRLRLAKVDTGSETLDIVCGAPNLEVGQLVPVALIGANLPIGMTIEKTEIRGQSSEGMICALDELGLGSDHEGIMVLDKKAKIGQSFAKYLNLNDSIIEIDNKSLSNRPDLWGHYGIAREVSAFSGYKLKDYTSLLKSKQWPIEADKTLEVKVEDNKLCPYYSALRLTNLKVAQSPAWLKDRLLAVGSKPINNIVDITNYIMLELGQPLHAFDATKVDKIIVRLAKKNEVLQTLDKEDRELDTKTLVIADNKKPIAIAGIMGGQESGIKDETTEIIIESANFDPVSVRLSSQRLGLRTDASARFEKSLDPNLCAVAMQRTVELIKRVCPEVKVDTQIAAVGSVEVNSQPISVSLDYLQSRLGQKISETEVIKILESLGFVVKYVDGSFNVEVPSWRATKDVTAAEDLLEEVARMIGYDNLPISLPQVEMRAPIVSNEYLWERKIKDILAGDNHLTEVHNYSFVNEKQLQKLQLDTNNYLKLLNPLSENHTLLRQSLASYLLENIKSNQARADYIALFEVGNVYLNIAGDLHQKADSKQVLPHQEKRLGIVLAGEGVDLFAKSKGIVKSLLEQLLDCSSLHFNFKESWPGWAAGNKSASIDCGNENIGQIMAVKSSIASQIGLKKSTVITEINLVSLFTLLIKDKNKKYQEPPKFPAVERDVSLIVDNKVSYKDLRQSILSFHTWIDDVELFDIYQGDRLEVGQRSLAFHIVYRSLDRTLQATEVDEVQTSLIKHLENNFQAQIRNF